MIGYVTLGTNDFDRSAKFYDALLGTLGAGRFMEMDNFIAWATEPTAPSIAIIKPFNEEEATVGNGVMVAIVLDSTEQGRCTPRQGPRARWHRRGCTWPARRRRLLRRLLSRSGRQQAERLLHWLAVAPGVPAMIPSL